MMLKKHWRSWKVLWLGNRQFAFLGGEIQRTDRFVDLPAFSSVILRFNSSRSGTITFSFNLHSPEHFTVEIWFREPVDWSILRGTLLWWLWLRFPSAPWPEHVCCCNDVWRLSNVWGPPATSKLNACTGASKGDGLLFSYLDSRIATTGQCEERL